MVVDNDVDFDIVLFFGHCLFSEIVVVIVVVIDMVVLLA